MSPWVWAGFLVFVFVMLALDLGVVNRKAHVIRTGEALRWTGVTVILALLFSVVVFFLYKNGYHGNPTDIVGTAIEASDHSKLAWKATTEYLGGWILEYALSLDNIFVILLIFKYFRVPLEHQHRVLFWGILGALVMRGLMIGAAGVLIHKIAWTQYLFGGFLIYTAVRLLFAGEDGVEPEKNFAVRYARRLFPVSKAYHGNKFIISVPESEFEAARARPPAKSRGSTTPAGGTPSSPPPPPPLSEDESIVPTTDIVDAPPLSPHSPPSTPARPVPPGTKMRRLVTPLFLVLIVVETTDVLFAVDSIPAVYGITKDPFLVFTSNVFAILGLRSLYFALAAVLENFRYLKTSLVFVLGFIGLKMVLEDLIHITPQVSLVVVLAILGTGAVASLFATKLERAKKQAPVDDLSEAASLAYRKGRKLVILVVGLTVLALSIPIGLLPGPGGIAVAVGGLAILATEFIWARALMKRLKEQTQKIAARADAMISKKPRPWLIPPVLAVFAALLYLGVHNAPYGPYKPVSWLGHIGPFEHRHVYFAMGGPAIAIGFWAYTSIKRWRQLREKRKAEATG